MASGDGAFYTLAEAYADVGQPMLTGHDRLLVLPVHILEIPPFPNHHLGSPLVKHVFDPRVYRPLARLFSRPRFWRYHHP
jgi:hypothetical protein